MIDLKKTPTPMTQDNPPPRTLYRRRCSVTGEGMNYGWLFEDDHDTVKYERDVIAVLRGPDYADFWSEAHTPLSERSDDDLLQAAFELNICYYTEWEDEIGPDDECYTLNGIPLEHKWQRVAYLDSKPCTNHEVAAVVLAAQGYMVWMDEGEVDGKWTGKQKVVVGCVWDKIMSDSTAVAIHDDEVMEYAMMFHEGRLHSVTMTRFRQLEDTPDEWRFIGWEDSYKEHGPRSSRQD